MFFYVQHCLYCWDQKVVCSIVKVSPCLLNLFKHSQIRDSIGTRERSCVNWVPDITQCSIMKFYCIAIFTVNGPKSIPFYEEGESGQGAVYCCSHLPILTMISVICHWCRVMRKRDLWVSVITLWAVLSVIMITIPCFRKKHPLILLTISWGIVVWF